MRDLAKIEELYHQALNLTPERREEFLSDSCGDDRELYSEVESLLSYDEKAIDFIESPPVDLAADIVNQQNREKLIGQHFNEYRILEKLGAGGMGEVYLAEDTRLGRQTAVKLLPMQFSQDEERRRRFEKEARAVSALNHPNIITLYGIEETESFNFIVTELVRGKTLREKISEKSLSPKEVIEIGIQIADALDSAHSLGIIHRDIKPANIMLRADGIVKVLDFGLAKLSKQGGDSADAETRDQTAPNGVMGTINYMSPEQALGQAVDFRTDIFSLGVVLYELLAGTKPFDGISDAAIYNATINYHPPSLSKLNNDIPLALDRVVGHTIAKNRENRYQTASELRRDLNKIKENQLSDLFADRLANTKRKSNFLRFALPVLAVILLSAVLYFLFFNRMPEQVVESKNFTYTQLTSESGEEISPSLSPDGNSYIYTSRKSGNSDIYLRRIGETNAINLTKDSPADDLQGVFSPDGSSIVFRSERDGGGIFLMSANGESIRKISDMGFYPNWSPDGKEIVYCVDNFGGPVNRGVVPSELWSINLASSEKRLITKTDAVQPNWSPHGYRIAFWGVNASSQRSIWTVAADGSDQPVAVVSDAFVSWNPFWSPDGKYLYFASDRSGSMNLWRSAIDEKTGAVLGNPEPVTLPSEYGQFFSFARDGKAIIYVQSNVGSNIWRVAFDPKSETVDKQSTAVTNDSTIKTDLHITADGKTLAYDTVGGKQEDIFTVDADGTNTRQLTNTIEKDRVPQWSPNGKRIAFYSNLSGKYEGWIMDADGSNLRRVTQTPADRRVAMPVWSPSGKSLVFNISNYYPIIFDPDAAPDKQTPQPLPHDTLPNHSFLVTSWSADGKKLVGYSSDLAKDRSGIAVYNFDSQKYQHLTDFGTDPYWLPDSRRILFHTDEALYLLDAETGKTKELLSVRPYRIQSTAITTDSRSIYYTIQKKESDIWLAKIQ